MDRNKKLVFVWGAVLTTLLLIFVLFIAGRHSTQRASKQNSTYVDKKTGATLYKQQQSTPEKGATGAPTQLAFVGGDTIIHAMTENQFVILRSNLSTLILAHDSSARLLQFVAGSTNIDNSNNILAAFTTNDSSAVYHLQVNIASINAFQIIVTSGNPPTTLLDTGYLDTSSVGGNNIE